MLLLEGSEGKIQERLEPGIGGRRSRMPFLLWFWMWMWLWLWTCYNQLISLVMVPPSIPHGFLACIREPLMLLCPLRQFRIGTSVMKAIYVSHEELA